LHYWLATSRQSGLQIVGRVFMPEMYGIAVALDSPLRKRLNRSAARGLPGLDLREDLRRLVRAG